MDKKIIILSSKCLVIWTYAYFYQIDHPQNVTQKSPDSAAAYKAKPVLSGHSKIDKTKV